MNLCLMLISKGNFSSRFSVGSRRIICSQRLEIMQKVAGEKASGMVSGAFFHLGSSITASWDQGAIKDCR